MKKITMILALLLLVSPVMAQEETVKATEESDNKNMHRSLYRRTLIELLEEVELTVSELYKVYGEKFPESENFWNDIAADEGRHARMVAGLQELSEEYNIYPNDDSQVRFNEDDARSTLSYLKYHLSAARKTTISFEEALDVSFNIEKSLVEKDFYTVFDGDGPAARVILQTMVLESKGHEQKIIGLIKKLKEIEGK